MSIVNYKKMVLFLLCLLVITNCGLFSENPKNVLSKYMDAMINKDYKGAYSYVSTEDKKIKNIEGFKKEMNIEHIAGISFDTSYINLIKNNTSYEIEKIEVNGNKAKATVKLRTPDFSEAQSEIMGEAFSLAFSDKSDEEMAKEISRKIVEKYKGKEIPLTTSTDTYNLVKESDGWKVFFDWKTEKQIDSLESLEEQFEKDKEFGKAIEQYEMVIELDSNYGAENSIGGKIEFLKEEKEEWKEKGKYIDKILVRNVHIGKSYFGETGVYGEVKNTGNKVLDEVEITIYCLDKNGSPVFEKDYHPVLSSEYSMSGEGPLKPNYSRKFGVRMDDAPSDWAKKVRVEITDIEFAE